MSSEIDDILYEQLMCSCPNCGSMNCVFGSENECLDCGFKETRDGVVLNPGTKTKN